MAKVQASENKKKEAEEAVTFVMTVKTSSISRGRGQTRMEIQCTHQNFPFDFVRRNGSKFSQAIIVLFQ